VTSNERGLIVFGIGDFAELANFYISEMGIKVSAFTLHKDYIDLKTFLGKPIIAFEEIETTHPPEYYNMFSAIGYKKRNSVKKQIFSMIKSKGYQTISYISPKANVCLKTTEIGENCFIFGDVTIEPFSKIGNNVTIWSGSSIAHHSTIGDHCFLAPKVAIAGRVTVGESCFFGVNSTVRDSIKIADNSIIGAGAVILHDTQPNRIYKSLSTPPLLSNPS